MDYLIGKTNTKDAEIQQWWSLYQYTAKLSNESVHQTKKTTGKTCSMENDPPGPVQVGNHMKSGWSTQRWPSRFGCFIIIIFKEAKMCKGNYLVIQ